MTLDDLILRLAELRDEMGGHHQVCMTIHDVRRMPSPVTGAYFAADHDEHKNVTREYIELDDEINVVATPSRAAAKSAP